jgi:hypothetical protein
MMIDHLRLVRPLALLVLLALLLWNLRLLRLSGQLRLSAL